MKASASAGRRRPGSRGPARGGPSHVSTSAAARCASVTRGRAHDEGVRAPAIPRRAARPRALPQADPRRRLGYDWFGDTRTVDVHIGQVRKKLGTALDITTVAASATGSNHEPTLRSVTPERDSSSPWSGSRSVCLLIAALGAMALARNAASDSAIEELERRRRPWRRSSPRCAGSSSWPAPVARPGAASAPSSPASSAAPGAACALSTRTGR